MNDDESLVAAGGWCAPSDTVYDPESLQVRTFDAITFEPTITVSRGGIQFTQPTPAEAAANEAMRARASRAVAKAAQQRRDAIDAACLVAQPNGWDLHIWTHPWAATPHIGIEFRPAEYAIPTIVQHEGYDATYDWDDD